MPNKKSATKYTDVEASPVKSFFVSTLTRDIRLEDSILDLLDNCVDGVLRSLKSRRGSQSYKGFFAKIYFTRDRFVIEDNCGGIPWKLHDYAWHMGRPANTPTDTPGTVGVYGIGMKRAVFKMGRQSTITTKHGSDSYEVVITPEWMNDDLQWTIPVNQARVPLPEDGTKITVEKLFEGIASRFSTDAKAFYIDLRNLIATHYAFIIEKGFSVSLNGKAVVPRPTKLIFDPGANGVTHPKVRPFMFRTKTDGVEVFLAVGFTRPIPSQDEAISEQDQGRYSALDAGWTIICNDRAVLYADRTELTGWGEGTVPRYHNQFIAIAGIVEFRSADPSKLPTTTTKRGIEASSRLYLQVKNKMREGMLIFVDYTNKWKSRAEEAKRHLEKSQPMSFEELRAQSKSLAFKQTRKSFPPGEQYSPRLPLPQVISSARRRISYERETVDIRLVSQFLFGDETRNPSEVGGQCFDLILQEAQR